MVVKKEAGSGVVSEAQEPDVADSDRPDPVRSRQPEAQQLGPSPNRPFIEPKVYKRPMAPVASSVGNCSDGAAHFWNRRGSNGHQRQYACKSCGFFVREKVIMGVWQRVM